LSQSTFSEELETLKKELSKSRKEQKQLQGEIDKLNNSLDLSERLQSEKTSEAVSLRTELDKLREEKVSVELELQSCQQRLIESQKLSEIVQDECQRASLLNDTLNAKVIESQATMVDKQEYDRLLSVIESLKSRKREIKKALESSERVVLDLRVAQNLKDLTQKEMERQLTEQTNRFKQSEQENLDVFQKKIDRFKARIEELRKENESISNESSEWKQKYTDKENDCQVQLAACQSQIEALSKESSSAAADAFRRQEEISQCREEISTLTEKCINLEKLSEKQVPVPVPTGEIERELLRMETEKDEMARNLAKAKREIRILLEDKEALSSLVAGKEARIRDLASRLE
jgi:chromosome segregation ATPase